eukprot:GEMP01002134.1.p1 GENE.GEMP01002134.1~~GEMP01002134.1.p1  ORF type:complete len:1055 (+),score=272.23 GEMP01002134.1:27-3191(+)
MLMYETSNFPKTRHLLLDDIINRITAILCEAGITGTVEPYGSFVSGFATSHSDIDVTLLVSDDIDPRSVLPKLISRIERAPGFHYVSRVFASKNQLIKFTDAHTDTDIELTVNNRLGIRNSALLCAYQDYDERIVIYARRVKDWCRHFDLVGSQDGCINSYGWILMAIHYIIKKNVVCNLQILAQATGVPQQMIKSSKCPGGEEDVCETRFWEDTSVLPKSKNRQSADELFAGFIEYYYAFDWHSHAVSIRTALPNVPQEEFKKNLYAPDGKEYPWHVEDPFDLKHNLAANTTEHGRCRIAEALKAAHEDPDWLSGAETPPQRRKYFLRATIGEQVAPDSLLDAFVSKDLVRLHYPLAKIAGREGALYKPAFFEFASTTGIKKALTLNEHSIDGCELRLLKATRSSVAHEITHWSYEEFDARKYVNAITLQRDHTDRSNTVPLQKQTSSLGSVDRCEDDILTRVSSNNLLVRQAVASSIPGIKIVSPIRRHPVPEVLDWGAEWNFSRDVNAESPESPEQRQYDSPDTLPIRPPQWDMHHRQHVRRDLHENLPGGFAFGADHNFGQVLGKEDTKGGKNGKAGYEFRTASPGEEHKSMKGSKESGFASFSPEGFGKGGGIDGRDGGKSWHARIKGCKDKNEAWNFLPEGKINAFTKGNGKDVSGKMSTEWKGKEGKYGVYDSRNGDERIYSSEAFRHTRHAHGPAVGYDTRWNHVMRTTRGHDGSPAKHDARNDDGFSPTNARWDASRTAPSTYAQAWLDNAKQPAASPSSTWHDFLSTSYYHKNEEPRRSASSGAPLHDNYDQHQERTEQATEQATGQATVQATRQATGQATEQAEAETDTRRSEPISALDDDNYAQYHERVEYVSEKAEADRTQDGGVDVEREREEKEDRTQDGGVDVERERDEKEENGEEAQSDQAKKEEDENVDEAATQDNAENDWRGGRWAAGWNNKKGAESNDWKSTTAQKTNWSAADWEKRPHSSSTSWNARNNQWDTSGHGWKEKKQDEQDRNNDWHDNGWKTGWNNDGGSSRWPQSDKSTWSGEADKWKNDAGRRKW